MQLKEKMAFNPDLVTSAREAINSLECACSDQYLADHLGEVQAVTKELTKAISKAKSALIERGVDQIEGIRWRVTVRGYERNTLDREALSRVVNLDQFQVSAHVVSVTFKSLY